jgi:hypothetical protein
MIRFGSGPWLALGGDREVGPQSNLWSSSEGLPGRELAGGRRPYAGVSLGSRHGLLVGFRGALLETFDGAANFVDLAGFLPADTGALRAVQALGPGRMIAVGEGGTVPVTSDGGRTWATLELPGVKLNGVRWAGEGQVLATTMGGRLLLIEPDAPRIEVRFKGSTALTGIAPDGPGAWRVCGSHGLLGVGLRLQELFGPPVRGAVGPGLSFRFDARTWEEVGARGSALVPPSSARQAFWDRSRFRRRSSRGRPVRLGFPRRQLCSSSFPRSSSGVTSAGTRSPSIVLTRLMWSNLLAFARWRQFQVSRKSQRW